MLTLRQEGGEGDRAVTDLVSAKTGCSLVAIGLHTNLLASHGTASRSVNVREVSDLLRSRSVVPIAVLSNLLVRRAVRTIRVWSNLLIANCGLSRFGCDVGVWPNLLLC